MKSDGEMNTSEIRTKHSTERPTEKSIKMSTGKPTGTLAMLCSKVHYREASTTQCQLPMTVEIFY
jgi:hypothetical protein